MTHLKIKSSLFPVKGLLTTLGATLILISLALDFSYGKSPKLSHLNFEIIKKLIFWKFKFFCGDLQFNFSQLEHIRNLLPTKQRPFDFLLGLDICHYK